MFQRFASIWFPDLVTDFLIRKDPTLKERPFALVAPEKGRRVIKAVNQLSQMYSVKVNMVVADARAILPELEVLDFEPNRAEKLLTAFAEWFLKYTPHVSLDLPDGLILDTTGCSHLWGGEQQYVQDILKRLNEFGYNTRVTIADTLGAAWAEARYGQTTIIEAGKQYETICKLPAAALRLEPAVLDRLYKLGLFTVGSFITMPRTALGRRFGNSILNRIDQAVGSVMELMIPVVPDVPYREHLPCIEPVRTAVAIEMGIQATLTTLCDRLSSESKGLRKCELKCHRIDGNIQKISIATSRPSRNVSHLFKLFQGQISQIEPDLGIELFILEALVVEDLSGTQEALWDSKNTDQSEIAELLDRLAGRTSAASIKRYLPAEHYWPERAITLSTSLAEEPAAVWRSDLPRPVLLLPKPEKIEVSVPIPDYPPLLFKYKGVLHTVKKADGPERIEQEWWIEKNLYRDYYCLEDENGARYWIFRAGDYKAGYPEWFLHGFFA